MVRAKFFVTEIKHTCSNSPGETFATITMAPVYQGKDGKPANAEWSKYTPSGKLEMCVTNPAAVEKFEVGKSYFIDFSPAD